MYVYSEKIQVPLATIILVLIIILFLCLYMFVSFPYACSQIYVLNETKLYILFYSCLICHGHFPLF